MKHRHASEKRDIWEKLESLAKLMGGAGAIVGAVLIPLILNKQALQNRKVQVYAEIMSQREAKDTEIRAQMFETLLSKYLDNQSDSSANTEQNRSLRETIPATEAFNEKIVFLSILMENFQEYFNAKPLFIDLYEKISDDIREQKRGDNIIEYETLEHLNRKLIELSRHTTARQVTMLSRGGACVG